MTRRPMVDSWGRLGATPHTVLPLRDATQARALITGGRDGLARGMGRSYGDACLNPGGTLWQATGLDHLLAFDDATGVLHCEAGVLLRDIQRLLVPRGWMLPVTPGTQLVTVGGAIANDVHGKNHHAQGCFGDHVRRLRLLRTDGRILDCDPAQAPEWLAATIGGLGLTGVILDAELQLTRVSGPWLATETTPFRGLRRFLELSDGAEAGWEHTVAWIDCLSGREPRGIFLRARPTEAPGRAEPVARERRMPMVPPVSLVNRLTLRPFNTAYYALNAWKAGPALAHYEKFLYPLDNLHDWNRLYGPSGFYQYQSVVPRAAGEDATRAMLDAIAASGEGSFLAVLKTFGERRSRGLLGFAMPGVTLALDFPNRGARTLRLFERMDAIVREAGGRLYPAKDARMPRELFEAGYPRLHEFMTYRDPGIRSGLSRRLMGH